MRSRLLCVAVLVVWCVGAQAAATKWAPAVKPKPLSENVKKGMAWLAKTQQKSGGWSQGEESEEMGRSLDNVRDTANVADTCMAAMALIRAGSTPSKGQYAANVRSAVNFVCAQVEDSKDDSLWVTNTRGTRTQMKLGQYIDTFMSSMLLTEVKGQMPDRKSDARVSAALARVMKKIEKNQRDDGTWGSDGWAPVLSQSMASRAINRAAQKGVKVDEQTRERAEKYALGQFDKSSGKFKGEGSAGVALYSAGGNLASIQQSVNANSQLEDKAARDAVSAPTAAGRKAAGDQLKRFASTKADLASAQRSVINSMSDKGFISGFGSNGGEEFLSYMNLGESMVVKGGKDWQEWDKTTTENLNRIQNKDGTWTGHHCITGRTFCTAAALMVLTTDRAPVPVAGDIKKR